MPGYAANPGYGYDGRASSYGSSAGWGGGAGRGPTQSYNPVPNVVLNSPRRVTPPTRAPSSPAPAVSHPQMPYQPEAPRASRIVDTLSTHGTGLLDPKSPYSTKVREEMMKGIGQQGAARKRAGMLAAIRGGMGGGGSPELLDYEADVGRSTNEAIGDASAQAMLAMPELGLRMLSPALSGELGLQGQRLSAYLTQQQMDAQAEQDRIDNQLRADQAATDAMLRELSLMGGFF